MIGTEVRDCQRNEACHAGDSVTLVFQHTQNQCSVVTMTAIEALRLRRQLGDYLGVHDDST